MHEVDAYNVKAVDIKVAFLGYLVKVNAQLGGQFGISYLQFF
jgi:hypothetical protein